jgi:hypothetical protein
MLITCTCCDDQIKGTQDKDFSYSFFASLTRSTIFASLTAFLQLILPHYLLIKFSCSTILQVRFLRVRLWQALHFTVLCFGRWVQFLS